MTKRRKGKPGPDTEHLKIDADPGEALDKLLGKPARHLPQDKLPSDKQAVVFWTASGPPEGRIGTFHVKGKLGTSDGIAWVFKEAGGKEYRHQVGGWRPR